MAQGIVCKGCALHQQSKVPGPSGIVVKLELGDQVSPRPAVGEGGAASIDDWALLNAGAACQSVELNGAKWAARNRPTKSRDACVTDNMCGPGFANGALAWEVDHESIYSDI